MSYLQSLMQTFSIVTSIHNTLDIATASYEKE